MLHKNMRILLLPTQSCFVWGKRVVFTVLTRRTQQSGRRKPVGTIWKKNFGKSWRKAGIEAGSEKPINLSAEASLLLSTLLAFLGWQDAVLLP